MIFRKLLDLFASLKLSVVILSLSLVLVFLGTLAQEPLGLYLTQERFFQSYFVDLASMSAAVTKMLQMFGVYRTPVTAMDVLTAPWVPVFPGGYTLGWLFLINLVVAQGRTFRWTWRRAGVYAVHVGLILLLVGQLATDMFALESRMHIREGEASNYSELDRQAELAVTEVLGNGAERVTVVGQSRLEKGGEIEVAALPFRIGIVDYYANSMVRQRTEGDEIEAAATQGFGPMMSVAEQPPTTRMDQRDMPSVILELRTAEGSLGTWAASFWVDRDQSVHVGDRHFRLSLRPKRLYKPFTLHLLDFRHELYPGTQIPKDFSSMVRLVNPSTGEDRELRIYMNNPLRYGGETYYQSGYDPDNRGTVLQVVRNPGWLTPYFACVVISIGLVGQFLLHLVGFFTRRRSA